MTVDQRQAAYVRGDSAKSPYRNTAKMISSPRRVKTPPPVDDEEKRKQEAARERYRKWKDNIFATSKKQERVSSATSEKRQRAAVAIQKDINEIKDA